MATELDVSKSRRFDIAMSRRTRRSTSLVACFQDQYTPSLAHHRHQELKAFLQRQDEELKSLQQCQEEELKALQQCEDAEQKTLCLNEDEDLKIPQAPLQYEDGEQKTPEQYEDEHKESQQCSDEEQEIPDTYQDDEKKPDQDQYLNEDKMPEQYRAKDELPSQYQNQELMIPNLPEKETASERFQDAEQLVTPNLPEEDEETAPKQFQDEEQKGLQQHQEPDEQASQPEEQKSQQECHEKAPEQFQTLKKLGAPPRLADNVPRFSLQELIQQKQLPTGDAMLASKQGSCGESVLADHSVSGPGAAAGGTTLAMVIKRPEGGKKSMGVIRRCVKALNGMIKAKHGSKKNLHF